MRLHVIVLLENVKGMCFSAWAQPTCPESSSVMSQRFPHPYRLGVQYGGFYWICSDSPVLSAVKVYGVSGGGACRVARRARLP